MFLSSQLFARFCVRVFRTNDFLQALYLILLLFELRLLLFDRIYQDDIDAVILDAFDLALLVVDDKQRVDFFDIFRAKPQIAQTAVFPVESNWPQAIDDVESVGVGREIGFVSEAGRAIADSIVNVDAEVRAAGRAERVYLQLTGHYNGVVTAAPAKHDCVACGYTCTSAYCGGVLKVPGTQFGSSTDESIVISRHG